jgi:hypothetical protein
MDISNKKSIIFTLDEVVFKSTTGLEEVLKGILVPFPKFCLQPSNSYLNFLPCIHCSILMLDQMLSPIDTVFFFFFLPQFCDVNILAILHKRN